MVWFGVLYVYFSICICNVFNLMIFVICIGEKFSFCVFWVVVIYRVVFCHDVKCAPIYVYFSVGYLFVLLMIHSLFDGRVDMISAKFAPWNRIEIKLGLIMHLAILHKFFVYIYACFVQFDELYICMMYLRLRIRLI